MEFHAAAQLLAQHRERFKSVPPAEIEQMLNLCASAGDHLRQADECDLAANEHREAAQKIGGSLDGLLFVSLKDQVEEKAGSPARPRGVRRIWRLLRPPASRSDAEPAAGRSPPIHDAKPAPDVTVAVLGPLEVAVREIRIARWGSQKNRTLFEYLVLHVDRPVRREVLMDLLWPGHGPASARNNLNVCLYSLRHTLHVPDLPDRHVLYRDGCYRLNPELTWWIDRDEFLSLIDSARAEAAAGRTGPAIASYERAIELYRGALFEDDPNADWFAPEQQSLAEVHLGALEDLAFLHLEARDLNAAGKTAQRVLRHDACRESAHRLLMRCYSCQHQRSLIVRQFRLCIDALRTELAVAPAEETVRLFHELTAADRT